MPATIMAMKSEPQGLGRFTKERDTEQHCSDSANARPDGICGADGQCADRQTEQQQADGHGCDGGHASARGA